MMLQREKKCKNVDRLIEAGGGDILITVVDKVGDIWFMFYQPPHLAGDHGSIKVIKGVAGGTSHSTRLSKQIAGPVGGLERGSQRTCQD